LRSLALFLCRRALFRLLSAILFDDPHVARETKIACTSRLGEHDRYNGSSAQQGNHTWSHRNVVRLLSVFVVAVGSLRERVCVERRFWLAMAVRRREARRCVRA
jgi:hypothetical protein